MTQPNRRPGTVIAAAVLTIAIVTLSSFGATYFGLFAPGSSLSTAALLFVAGYLAVNVTALAGAVGLLRGQRSGWGILVGYVIFGVLFTLVKLIVFSETEATVFGVADLVLLALVAAPATRRFVASAGRRPAELAV